MLRCAGIDGQLWNGRWDEDALLVLLARDADAVEEMRCWSLARDADAAGSAACSGGLELTGTTGRYWGAAVRPDWVLFLQPCPITSL